MAGCASQQALKRDQAEVEKLANENRAAIDACYKEAIEENPELEGGKLHIRASQNPDGSFYRVRRLQGFAGSTPLFQCIRDEIETWKSDRPYTQGDIDLSWNFKIENVKDPKRLPQDQLHQTMNQYQEDFQSCHREVIAPSQNKRWEDTVLDFRFRIYPNGQASDLEWTKTASAQEVEDLFSCLSNKMNEWKFPEAQAPTKVQWSWVLE